MIAWIYIKLQRSVATRPAKLRIEAAGEKLRAMRLRRPRRIEDLRRFLVQELRVLGVHDEPAKLRWECLNESDVVDEAVHEVRLGDSVVARLGGVSDEVAALEALLQRALMARGGCAGRGGDDEEEQGRPGPHRLPMVHQSGRRLSSCNQATAWEVARQRDTMMARNPAGRASIQVT